MLFIGCYAPEGQDSLFAYQFNEQAGQLTQVAQTSLLANPSYLFAEGDELFAVSEYQPENGFIAKLRFDGQFHLLQKNSSLGAAPCHIAMHGQSCFVSNYFGGNLVAYSRVDLTVQGFRQHEAGSAVVSERQARAHIHSSILSADGQYLLCADLGQDKVVIYKSADLTLVGEFGAGKGSGPRHMAWCNGQLLLVNELNNTLLVCDFTAGQLQLNQCIALLPDGFSGESYAAEIKVSRDQRFVYVSNRGHDSISVFSVAKEGLSLLQSVPTLGSFPRHFALSPNEQWLLVANQLGDCVVRMQRDGNTGLLTDAQVILTIGAPVNVLFTD